ncbi:hypothetical protein MKS88_003458 [Plasmodium brasilianum]|uniref:Uncharacterized protein n=1 Tax=Plasmodium brasilianum TaxID=5824 RepID=A0ACB9Y9Z7_PLABR|nr:hypothetical protein MKS88_003458 [Plasmodium brasilianum]
MPIHLNNFFYFIIILLFSLLIWICHDSYEDNTSGKSWNNKIYLNNISDINTKRLLNNFKNSLNSEVHDYFEKLLRESKTPNQTNKYILKEKRSSFITKILKNIDEKYEK